MKWLKINKKKLHFGEVLAGCFEEHNYGYKEKLVGYLSSKDGVISCDSGSELLENCTHYIDINSFDNQVIK